MMTETLRVVCPNCKKVTDRQMRESAEAPDPGTISICSHCAQVNVFEVDMSLRAITAGELNGIMSLYPETFVTIVKAASYIKGNKLLTPHYQ